MGFSMPFDRQKYEEHRKMFMTQIQISRDTARKLKKSKLFVKETYDEVLSRLLKDGDNTTDKIRRLEYDLKREREKLTQLEKAFKKEVGLKRTAEIMYDL